MEKLQALEKQVKMNLNTATDTASLKQIKEETKNLEAVKIGQNLFEIYGL